MKVTVEVQGKTPAEIGKELAAAAATFTGAKTAGKKAATAAPETDDDAEFEDDTDEAEEIEAASDDADADDADKDLDADEAEETGPSLSDVMKAMKRLTTATSLEDSAKLLKKVGGVKAVKNLPKSKFAAVIKAAATATKKATN